MAGKGKQKLINSHNQLREDIVSFMWEYREYLEGDTRSLNDFDYFEIDGNKIVLFKSYWGGDNETATIDINDFVNPKQLVERVEEQRRLEREKEEKRKKSAQKAKETKKKNAIEGAIKLLRENNFEVKK